MCKQPDLNTALAVWFGWSESQTECNAKLLCNPLNNTAMMN